MTNAIAGLIDPRAAAQYRRRMATEPKSPTKFRASKLEPWQREAGDNLDRLIKATGVKPSQLAQALGIATDAQISQFRNKKRPYNWQHAAKMAQVLGCQVDDLSSVLAKEVARRRDARLAILDASRRLLRAVRRRQGTRRSCAAQRSARRRKDRKGIGFGARVRGVQSNFATKYLARLLTSVY